MKIKNKTLLEVSEADLVDGVFENHEIKAIGDYCFHKIYSLKKVVLPNVKKCGSDCFCYNDSLTQLTLPVLALCGGWCLCNNDSLTQLTIGKRKLNVKNVDDDCFVIETQHFSNDINIYSGYVLDIVHRGEIIKRPCYVADKDGFTAHGKNVKQAVADLKFKIIAEKLKNEPIEAHTMITINYYRTVTGACEFGVRSWLEQNNLTDKTEMRADELLPILEKTGAYGVERFRQLVKF